MKALTELPKVLQVGSGGAGLGDSSSPDLAVPLLYLHKPVQCAVFS